jgi:hypothetical protein
MGMQSLPNLESAGSRPALRLVSKRDGGSSLSLDMAFQDVVKQDAVSSDRRESLGCARGVIMALGFQAAALIVGTALWKLHFLFH